MTSTTAEKMHPINSVPLEVLTQFFDHAVDCEPVVVVNKPSNNLNNNSRVVISNVCKRWRAVIKDMAWIWTDLVLNLDNMEDDETEIQRILQQVSSYVKLSKARNFSCTAKGTSTLDVQVIIKALVHIMGNEPSAKRLQSLKIECPMDTLNTEFGRWEIENVASSIHLRARTLPQLKELEILWGSKDAATHLSFPYTRADWGNCSFLSLFNNPVTVTPGQIETVTLDSLLPVYDMPTWINVKQLKIKNIFSLYAFVDHLPILSSLTKLEELEFSFYENSPEFFGGDDLPEVSDEFLNYRTRPSLPKLRKLEITTSHYDEPLGLEIPEDYDDTGPLDIEYVLDMLPLAPEFEYGCINIPYRERHHYESVGLTNMEAVCDLLDHYADLSKQMLVSYLPCFSRVIDGRLIAIGGYGDETSRLLDTLENNPDPRDYYIDIFRAEAMGSEPGSESEDEDSGEEEDVRESSIQSGNEEKLI